MTKIAVLGGTGYAGRHIVAEAADRGFEVTSYSRNLPDEQIASVTYVLGNVTDTDTLIEAVSNSDVVVCALAPRGELSENLRSVTDRLFALANSHGTRVGIVGGAGSLEAAPGGPLVMEGEHFPAHILPEASTIAAVLADARATPPSLDWFMLSPAAMFGSYNPGVKTGAFRLGGDQLVSDADGKSDISGADYAIAFVDEIEKPQHSRQRFTAAY